MEEKEYSSPHEFVPAQEAVNLDVSDAKNLDDLYGYIRRIYNSEGAVDQSVGGMEIINAIQAGDWEKVPEDLLIRETAKRLKSAEETVN